MRIQMKIFALLIFTALLAAACAPAAPGSLGTPNSPASGATALASGATATPLPANGDLSALPPAASAALPELAKSLGIPASQLVFRSAEAVMWPDSCLGVTMKNEMCSMVVTPGYKILFEANGQTIEVHTNQSGSSFRVANAPAKSVPISPGSSTSSTAVTAAIKLLAQQAGVSESSIAIVKVEKVQWPDGCLGVEAAGRVCTQSLTPGYRILLTASGKQYEYHTDEAGGIVYPALAPLPDTALKVIVWEQTVSGACTHAEFGVKGAAAGACGAALKQSPLSPDRIAELAYFYATYQKFDGAGTPAGTVSFTGVGQKAATPAEMRSMAEWARLAAAEAQGQPATGAPGGMVLHWHREGGIAGFCDDLTLYRTGWAVASTCKTGQSQTLNTYRLTADELAKVYQWLDGLKMFNYSQKDAAAADSMAISLSFEGAGSLDAAPDQQQVAQFASQVYVEASK